MKTKLLTTGEFISVIILSVIIITIASIWLTQSFANFGATY